ncbi:hypothetical protein NO365_01174 [Planktothrix agardhii]|jgi:hypothetical protein|nr:hypothetical protein NO365_01174 [Planktothrix agardhii]
MTTKEIILHELEQIPASQNVIPQSHESFTFKIAQSEETYQEFKQPPQTPRARGARGRAVSFSRKNCVTSPPTPFEGERGD